MITFYFVSLKVVNLRCHSNEKPLAGGLSRHPISSELAFARGEVNRSEQPNTLGMARTVLRNAGGKEKSVDELREEFPGVNGFSAANLWRMNNLSEAYGANEKLAQLVREIGWSHKSADRSQGFD
jgi:hypothetical protein